MVDNNRAPMYKIELVCIDGFLLQLRLMHFVLILMRPPCPCPSLLIQRQLQSEFVVVVVVVQRYCRSSLEKMTQHHICDRHQRAGCVSASCTALMAIICPNVYTSKFHLHLSCMCCSLYPLSGHMASSLAGLLARNGSRSSIQSKK